MNDQFRLWADEEIVDYLRKFLSTSIITADDLKCPQPGFVIPVFSGFLVSLQVNLESLRVVPFEIADVLDNDIEWPEETVYLITFKCLLSYIMQFLGIVDIGIKDFLEPKPKRTRKLVVCLIQLVTRYAVKVILYEQMATQCQEEADRKKDILNMLKLIKQESDELQANMERKQGLDVVTKAHEEDLEKETVAKDALSAEYQKLKTKQADLVQHLCKIVVDIESAKVGLEELGQKIIKSPDRLDNEMEQLKQKIQELTIKSKEEHAENVKQKKVIASLNDRDDVGIEACSYMDEICSVNEQCFSETATTVASGQVKFKKVQEDVKIMKNEMEKEEEQKYLCEQWIAKENMNRKKQIEAIKQIMLINNEELQKLDGTCENYMREVAVHEEISKALKTKVIDKTMQLEVFSNKVHEELCLFTKKFLDYNDSYRKSFTLISKEGLNLNEKSAEPSSS